MRLSKRQLRKLSSRDNRESVVAKMREDIKRDPIVIEKFKEYGVPISTIDSVPIDFVQLDVSAKTKDKHIYLNEKMLSPGKDVPDPRQYLAHELVHFLQQSTGKNRDDKAEDYLDKDSEKEAFSEQIDYIEEHEGEDAAETYTSKLLDYHDIKGKERNEKKQELLDA